MTESDGLGIDKAATQMQTEVEPVIPGQVGVPPGWVRFIGARHREKPSLCVIRADTITAFDGQLESADGCHVCVMTHDSQQTGVRGTPEELLALVAKALQKPQAVDGIPGGRVLRHSHNEWLRVQSVMYEQGVADGRGRARTERAIEGRATPSEAVFAFTAWLSGHNDVVFNPAEEGSAVACDLVTAFCEANGWESPRENVDWSGPIKHPVGHTRTPVPDIAHRSSGLRYATRDIKKGEAVSWNYSLESGILTWESTDRKVRTKRSPVWYPRHSTVMLCAEKQAAAKADTEAVYNLHRTTLEPAGDGMLNLSDPLVEGETWHAGTPVMMLNADQWDSIQENRTSDDSMERWTTNERIKLQRALAQLDAGGRCMVCDGTFISKSIDVKAVDGGHYYFCRGCVRKMQALKESIEDGGSVTLPDGTLVVDGEAVSHPGGHF